jgi:hypothetical protein
MPAAQMALHALLYFGSFTAVIILFLDVIAATWWLLKRGLCLLADLCAQSRKNNAHPWHVRKNNVIRVTR